MDIVSSIINSTKGMTINITLQQQDTSWIIALSIALITLGGIIWSNLQTRKSNKLLETDLKNRLKPVVQIFDIRPYTAILPDGSSVNWEDYAKSRPPLLISFVTFKGELRNLGTVPVLKIKSKWLQQIPEIKRDDLKSGTEDPSFPLGVGEHYPLTYFVKWEDYAKSSVEPVHLGMKIQYDVFEGVEEIGKIWAVQHGVIISKDYWIQRIGS